MYTVAKADSCNQFIVIAHLHSAVRKLQFLYIHQYDIVINHFDFVLQLFHSFWSVMWFYIIAVALVSL